MKIRLLAFASASDAVGGSELELELPEGATVGDLKERLERDHAALAGLWHRVAVAVDGELAQDSTALADGAEVALLPPVSGGCGEASGVVPAVEITESPLDVDGVAARVAGPDCGALVVFVGTVRDRHHGRPVERLGYTAYRPMALVRMRRIAGDLERSFAGTRVALVHRLGTLEPGVASVVIAVASPHRDAAYQASRQALERLKAEVPIWKREHYAGGAAAWREEEVLARPGSGGYPSPPR
ncbi:MAG TPA: molybdenum cofactor biosynthesis protein MoaE [Thermoanaerobaculia bacterium]|nr:molybdenum cofactor biosynthesis protein MoaE [Thermoanaerobaculia bacterium]